MTTITRSNKYNLLDLLNIITYLVYAQASRFSKGCVGGTINDLDSLRDFQLNYALHNTYSSKLRLLCHLAFAVLAHFPFSVPAINGTINCFQLQPQSKQQQQQRANNNHNLYIKHIKDKSSSAKSTRLDSSATIAQRTSTNSLRSFWFWLFFCFYFDLFLLSSSVSHALLLP